MWMANMQWLPVRSPRSRRRRGAVAAQPRAPQLHHSRSPPLVVPAQRAPAWLRDQGRGRERHEVLRRGLSAHEKLFAVLRPTGTAWCRQRRRHSAPASPGRCSEDRSHGGGVGGDADDQRNRGANHIFGVGVGQGRGDWSEVRVRGQYRFMKLMMMINGFYVERQVANP